MEEFFSTIPASVDIPVHFCRFDIAHYHENLFDLHRIHRPKQIKSSVKKRQAEFFAGRYSASQVLGVLSAGACDIHIGDNRCPKWPERFTGSISHSDGLACCTVVEKNQASAVGIDIQHRIKQTTIEQISRSIIDECEKALLINIAIPFNDLFTAVFSAKESLFKALYPSVRRYFDFSAAKVTAVDPDEQSITLTLASSLSAEFSEGTSILSRFQTFEDHLITSVVLRPDTVS